MAENKGVKGFNIFIGVAMMAGATILELLPGGVVTGSLLSFVNQLLGSSTEFFGDGLQGLFEQMVNTCKKNKSISRLSDKMRDLNLSWNEYEFDCHQLYQELRGSLDIHLGKKIEDKLNSGKELSKMQQKKLNKSDAKMIMSVTNEILLSTDYDSVLQEVSPYYTQLKNDPKTESKANYILALIEEAIDFYVKDYIHNCGDDTLTFYAAVMVRAIKEMYSVNGEIISEEVAEKIAQKIAFRTGGEVSLEHASLSQSPFKYVLNACPGCGYDGPMIYVDDKTNTMHCAACGCSYHALEYAEPELWKECEEKFNGIDGKFDGLKSLLMEISNKQTATDEQVEALKQLVGQKYQVLIDLCKDCNAKSENLDNAIKQLKEGLKSAVTQQYLENALSGQNEKMKGYVDQAAKNTNTFVTQCFENYMGQISNQLGKNKEELLEQIGAQNKKEADARKKNTDAILKAIATVNETNVQYNKYLSQRLDSLDRQVGELFDYAKQQFDDLQGKDDLILQYVKTLCTKEEFQDKLNAMGSDLISAIMVGMDDVRGEVALTRISIAQIMSSIEDLKKQSIRIDGTIDTDELEKKINAECMQISGQISGIKTLIENSTAENRAYFKAIIESQEEIKAILLSRIGLTVTKQQDFERLYNGKLPDALLVNDGLGGEFKCPYCGAVMERKINDSQYCRCSICGQKYIPLAAFCESKINPIYTQTNSGERNRVVEMLEKKYGRDAATNEYIVTDEKIQAWREKHTAKLKPFTSKGEEETRKPNSSKNSYYVKWIPNDEGILIIPKEDVGNGKIEKITSLIFDFDDKSNMKLKTILIGANISCIDYANDSKLNNLKYIVFYEGDNLNIGAKAFCTFRRKLGISTHILGGTESSFPNRKINS